MKTVAACLWIVLAILPLAGPSTSKEPFSLLIGAVQGKLPPGSQVELKLTLTNTSDREIIVRDTNRWCDYLLEVRDGEGQLVPETEYKRDLTCRGAGHVSIGKNIVRLLKPHESFEDQFLLNQSYDLSRPDDYSIQVIRPISTELGTGVVKSNTIFITLAK